jgi:hypothetical protein
MAENAGDAEEKEGPASVLALAAPVQGANDVTGPGDPRWTRTTLGSANPGRTRIRRRVRHRAVPPRVPRGPLLVLQLAPVAVINVRQPE